MNGYIYIYILHVTLYILLFEGTYESRFIAEKEWPVDEQIGEHAEVVLA